MNKKYWENLAAVHQDEMFNVFANDRKKRIVSYIKEFSSGAKTVTDLGCAYGRWLPVLSKYYKKVYAVDIAASFIAMAKDNHKHLKNIEYIQADAGHLQLTPADVVLCVNAVMTPDHKKRDDFFSSIAMGLKKKGYLILVVPSLESALFAESMLDWWHFKDQSAKVPYKGDNVLMKYENLRSGIFDIDNVPTKHYLKDEVKAFLPFYGLELKAAEKIEYNWNTEFEDPPEWLQKPGPWDWLFIARKK